MLIVSPYFSVKSFPCPLTEAGTYVPLAILYCFLKSSSPAMKSKESFLSGKPTPIMAF